MYDVGMKRTNIYLTEPSVERLQALSAQTGLSVAELIRRAIDDFLKKQK
ncbi:ribbon-helix-helix domain-containing protein [Polaromonas naphthalenivorans]